MSQLKVGAPQLVKHTSALRIFCVFSPFPFCLPYPCSFNPGWCFNPQETTWRPLFTERCVVSARLPCYIIYNNSSSNNNSIVIIVLIYIYIIHIRIYIYYTYKYIYIYYTYTYIHIYIIHIRVYKYIYMCILYSLCIIIIWGDHSPLCELHGPRCKALCVTLPRICCWSVLASPVKSGIRDGGGTIKIGNFTGFQGML